MASNSHELEAGGIACTSLLGTPRPAQLTHEVEGLNHNLVSKTTKTSFIAVALLLLHSTLDTCLHNKADMCMQI